MKFAGCHTRNNLEHIVNVVFNTFETPFLPSGPVIVSNTMDVNGFSQNIQDLLDMAVKE